MVQYCMSRSQVFNEIPSQYGYEDFCFISLRKKFSLILPVHNCPLIYRRALLTSVSTFNQCLIDVLLSGVFQDVEETQVDSVRLFQDDVQQLLSGFD